MRFPPSGEATRKGSHRAADRLSQAKRGCGAPQPGHLARNPFGQIPTWEAGGLVLFETGAIVLHIAERHPGLLPTDADGRARAIAWMFAAVGTMAPRLGA